MINGLDKWKSYLMWYLNLGILKRVSLASGLEKGYSYPTFYARMWCRDRRRNSETLLYLQGSRPVSVPGGSVLAWTFGMDKWETDVGPDQVSHYDNVRWENNVRQEDNVIIRRGDNVGSTGSAACLTTWYMC